jgi:hypothetical protein
MGPLTAEEVAPRLQTPQAKKYATAVDRESAREVLEKRHAASEVADQTTDDAVESERSQSGKRPSAATARDDAGGLGAFLRSPVARSIAVTVAGTLTRTLLGALTGRRRR